MEKESYIHWIRERVGPRKIFLAFASVVVRDDYKRILLQKRTDFNVWGLPGGVLELDEDLQTCARRELYEETGLRVGPLRLIGIYTDPCYDVKYPNGDEVQQFTICFEGKVSGGVMKPDGIETSDQAFFPVEAMQDLDIPIWYRDMIRDANHAQTPTFNPPRKKEIIEDQIATIRPLIGHALYSGVGASAIIENDRGQYLMLKHRGENSWRPPAGFSDLGENAAYTAVRETLEETGLLIEPTRILAIHSTPRLNVTYPNGDKTRNVGVVFKARLIGGEIEVDGHEIEELAWMTREDAYASFDEKRRWFIDKLLENYDEGYYVC